MTKAEARDFVDRLALPLEQSKAIHRAISRATRSEAIDIVSAASGEVVVRLTRPGLDGHQVIESTVGLDGAKQVVQKAYDSAGNLVHFDPKGGVP